MTPVIVESAVKVTAFAKVRAPAPPACSVPPSMVRVPVPKAESLPATRVPAVSVVPPV